MPQYIGPDGLPVTQPASSPDSAPLTWENKGNGIAAAEARRHTANIDLSQLTQADAKKLLSQAVMRDCGHWPVCKAIKHRAGRTDTGLTPDEADSILANAGEILQGYLAVWSDPTKAEAHLRGLEESLAKKGLGGAAWKLTDDPGRIAADAARTTEALMDVLRPYAHASGAAPSAPASQRRG